jgi:putative ABC transport system permease protein
LRLDVPRTLRPQFLEEGPGLRATRARSSGVTLIAVPFMVLLYVLVRPFFVEVLPSLAFFVIESGAVCAGFLSMLVLVPELVRVLGKVVAVALPRGPMAPRLLTVRRIERVGQELAWAVSGVMLVFALLLALHIVTHALKLEVVDWAKGAVDGRAFIYAHNRVVPEALLEELPDDVVYARFSGRSPWPSSLLAVDERELVKIAHGDGEAAESAARALGKGKVILSTMMSRRFGINKGDYLQVESSTRTAKLEVVAVTDDVGFVPMVGPYRNSKTYGLISAADFDLIQTYAPPIGTGVVMKDPQERWSKILPPFSRRWVRIELGTDIEADRVRETNKDFIIFDMILFLTGLLAAIGIANNLVLSAHMRRREIALYRVLGMEVAQIRTMFVMEGAFIGLLGGILAVVLGIPLGFGAIGALEVISAFAVRFELPPVYALFTVLGALVISTLSALYPAARASRLSAAESVHYE